MTSSIRLLSDCVDIKRQFLRSVNLEKDCQADRGSGNYIITPTARQILRRLAEGLSAGSTYRAWTITGPYGVGKSAFAVFLIKVMCSQVPGSKSARRHLEDADQVIAKDLSPAFGRGRGMLPVAVTARRVPAAVCLAEGIRASLAQIKSSDAKQLSVACDALLRDLRKGMATDTRRVVALADALAKSAHSSGYSGLLFMVDELGKLFEFAARVPQKADVFVLQELAEHASRSGDFPVLFLGFLHQSFEEYGQHLDSLTRKEWAKIHGRFEDIAFLEPADQVIRMVAEAITWTGKPLSSDLSKHIRQVARISAENGACPPGMRKGEFEEICMRTYPLHPVTVVTLPYIFRRFAQNERSLFSYLSSMEPSGFQDFLRKHSLTDHSPIFLRLNHLFDYFTINFGSGLFRQPQARRWLEAADVLDRKENLTHAHGEIIKTIGVLGALGEFSHLSASESMISAAVGDKAKMPTHIEEGLRYLQGQSILTHRRFNKTYRIWEGSDVDIDERIAEGERQLRGRIGLASSIAQYLEPRPIVARRHSYLTGSLRYFSVIYLDDVAKVSENLSPSGGASGQVLVCISSSPPDLQAFREMAISAGRERSDLVFAIPQQIGEIRSAVAELAALRWVWENTPELRDDRVARREIALRVTEAEHFLRRTLGALLDPRKEPLGSDCLWYWNGYLQNIRSRVDVSQMLSTICDKVYSKTPWVRNELLARRSLSSAAAGARRNLVEKMLTASALPGLGIEGYPPERSMYESVLKATGLHREVREGIWAFVDPPERKHHGLASVWGQLRQMIFESDSEPRPLDAVFRELSEAPYGVPDGIHPVLLCAFLMAHPDEMTFYREGTFIPEPAISDFEILMRRPDLFGVAGSRITGARAAVVERLAKGLNTKPATVPVVRALFRMVKPLPECSWRTKRLSEQTIKLREAFERAKSPEKFLYDDVPSALGLPPFKDSKPDQKAIEAFFSVLNGALKEWSGFAQDIHGVAKAILLKACGFEQTDSGWNQLREIAAKLEAREGDPVLLQFFKRVAQSAADEAGIASVLALVVNRPPVNWLDSDIERFPALAKALGDAIKRAMARAGLGGEKSGAMDGLTSEQRERARTLAYDIRKKIGTAEENNSPEVLRAALLLLADRLGQGVKEKK